MTDQPPGVQTVARGEVEVPSPPTPFGPDWDRSAPYTDDRTLEVYRMAVRGRLLADMPNAEKAVDALVQRMNEAELIAELL